MGRGDELLGRPRLRQVPGQAHHHRTGGAGQLRRGGLGAVGAAAGDRDAGAVGREGPGRGQPHPGASAEHQVAAVADAEVHQLVGAVTSTASRARSLAQA